MSIPFAHLITLEPLGLLYASSGRFLSAENLVGKAGEHFPPDSPAFAGLVATQLPRAEVRDLHTAGPFWVGEVKGQEELMLPAPFNLLQQKPAGDSGWRSCSSRLVWKADEDRPEEAGWQPADGSEPPAKPIRGGWIPLSSWNKQHQPGFEVRSDPWTSLPHLHPRLRDDERVSAQEGALFLELAVALEPGVRLAYLCSHHVEEGRYRFGGEGHLVELRVQPVPEALIELLKRDLKGSFALVTPGLWGGKRLSQREPLDSSRQPAIHPWRHGGRGPALLTDRPQPWRHRLGEGNKSKATDGKRRLSRGRWAVPPGTCVQVPAGHTLLPWPSWPESWFPREGFSFKQLGTGLALPIP
ncbi:MULTISPECIES: type III-B CRISPR module-associated protein Cmr3 [unclassified Synechococcus]|uniref:type III-B CRISPR module-associated protein Cmr3 n=1 Tax=unclassified Synechococcus TaxID=2626047 RepID=UPI0021A82E51|nr:MULTISPECIES: type III-B CRISPR module-associated protein Cmr3 [unclassified Synechococcus]MCT0212420.1 type III-B CRISPR module-associated protein Cmr3 [Synechococcus sp. CS-1326]MCT0234603.1 type III-B CRISPR module-associated protein Cmr3 [Synechococcus sp. CS-1327]